MAQTKLVVGNWKMNGGLGDMSLVEKIAAVASEVKSTTQTVICVPSVFIKHFADKNLVQIGAQDCHHLQKGAHTGDISADMVKEVGGSHIIVGHSERRIDHHETNEMIHAKADSVFNVGLTPIICVGESHEEYKQGKSGEVIVEQLKNSIPKTDKPFAIGYEPIWAIGTGLIPQLNEISLMHNLIRKTLGDLLGEKTASNVKILYGGSVKANNAADIAGCSNVDGSLVGGASLNADDFGAIIRAFSQ